jgi:hypothetical protein
MTWSFLNEVTGNPIEDLSLKQARAFFNAVPRYQHHTWLCWHKVLLEWQPLDQFTEISDDFVPEEKSAQAAPNKNQPAHFFEPEGISEPLEVEEDRRINQRFDKQFLVEITTPTGDFTSRTTNVSTTGLLLEDPVPQSVNSKVLIRMSREDHIPIDIQCEVIRSPMGKNTSRLRFRSITTADKIRLRGWLLSTSEQ